LKQKIIFYSFRNFIYIIHLFLCTIAVGIIDNVSETSDAANSVNDTDGVYFVPAFSGLQVYMFYYNNKYNIIINYIFQNI